MRIFFLFVFLCGSKVYGAGACADLYLRLAFQPGKSVVIREIVSDIGAAYGNPQLKIVTEFHNTSAREVTNAFFKMSFSKIWPGGLVGKEIALPRGRRVLGLAPDARLPFVSMDVDQIITRDEGSRIEITAFIRRGPVSGENQVVIYDYNGKTYFEESWKNLRFEVGSYFENIPVFGWGARIMRNVASYMSARMHADRSAAATGNIAMFIMSERENQNSSN